MVGVHDEAKVVKGGHCMHADATDTHSQLQHLVGGLVVWSCDDHELCLIAVDLELSVSNQTLTSSTYISSCCNTRL